MTPPQEADKRDINVQHITFTGPQVAAVIASLVIGLFAYLGGLGAMWTQLNAKIDDVRIESAQNYLSLSKGLLEIDKKILKQQTLAVKAFQDGARTFKDILNAVSTGVEIL